MPAAVRFRGWQRMSKKNKKPLVPKLRFTEFRDYGEWKERPISDLLIEVNRPMDMVDTEDYSLVTVKRRYGGIVTRDILKGFSIKVKSQFYIQENDFLISKRQIVHNACGVVPKEFAGSIVSNEYSVLKATQDCDIAFFNYFSQQPIVSRSFLNCSIGIHIEKMLFRLNDWFKQEFLFPAIKEQQKIADCLSSLDKLITAETQKLEAYKAHKKGLMQQLFPAEGETVPELRFPEFRDAGEWEEYSFGKLIKIFSGKGFRANEYVEAGIRLLQIENVGYGVTKWSGDIIYLPKDYTNKYPEFILREGDIVLALNRPVTNNELKIALLNKDDEPSLLYQRVGKLELLSEELVVNFVFHLSRHFIKNFVVKQSIGSDQPFISVRGLYKQQIIIPKPAEQQKIADCLSSLDELITAEAQKIDTLKAHKKGLMQGLFPSANEVGV